MNTNINYLPQGIYSLISLGHHEHSEVFAVLLAYQNKTPEGNISSHSYISTH